MIRTSLPTRPGSYAHGDGRWALLGHDVNIHPAYLARVGAMPAWSPVIVFPPTGGDYQYDGSMSARYDPQYEVDCTVIDVVFFDEDSDARGGFRPDLYYGAIRLAGSAEWPRVVPGDHPAVTARCGGPGR